MEFSDAINALVKRIPLLQDSLQTEEATKNALIMPMLQALGYNVFDPFEVVPEYSADVATKKNEKVDYVIMLEGKPAILVECKSVSTQLSIKHAGQLFRYFSCTEAHIAILTNGIDYQFYTDIETPNKMDEKPFFELSLLNINARQMAELKKFSREGFKLENILDNASDLKYKKQLRELFSKELEQPSDEFVKLFAGRVFDGTLTAARRERFSALVAQSFREWVNIRISEKLQNALDSVGPSAPPEPAPVPAPQTEAPAASDDGIVTTEDELEAFHIVRAILAKVVDPKRVFIKDAKSYCAVLLDFNNRKPLCRFLFNSSQLTLILLDRERNEKRIALETVTDIYQHADELIEYAKLYL